MAFGRTNAGGLAVKQKEGSFTTNSSGAFSFDVGFVPDLVIIWPDETYTTGGKTYEAQLSFDFTARKYQQYTALAIVPVPEGFYQIDKFIRNSSTVSGTLYGISFSFETTPLSNKTLDYLAIKYTTD